MRQYTDTAGNGTSRRLESKPLEKGGGAELEKYTYMRRPGDSKQARFESRCCPQVLFRKRRFYSKCLLFGVFASEAARQLTSFFG